jgi:hypothetical protein
MESSFKSSTLNQELMQRLSLKIFLLIPFLLFSLLTKGVDFTWKLNPQDNLFLNHNNWNSVPNTPNAVPGVGDRVFITGGNVVPYLPPSNGELVIGSLTITGSATILRNVVFDRSVRVTGAVNIENANIISCSNRTLTVVSGTNNALTIRNSVIWMKFDADTRIATFQKNTFHYNADFLFRPNTLSTTNGGNIFNGNTFIKGNINSPFISLAFGVNEPDVFNGNLTIHACSTSVIRMAHSSGGNLFNRLNLKVEGGSSLIYIGSGTAPSTNIANVNVINGDIVIESGSVTGSGGSIYLGSTTSPLLEQVSGTLRKPDVNQNFFGNLFMTKFKIEEEVDLQLMNDAQLTLLPSRQERIHIGRGCEFQSEVTFDAPTVYINGGVFHKKANFIKRSNVNLNFAGGATFHEDVVFTTTNLNDFTINFSDISTYPLNSATPAQTNEFKKNLTLIRKDNGSNSRFVLNNGNNPDTRTIIGGDLTCSIGTQAGQLISNITTPVLANYLEFNGNQNQTVWVGGIIVSKDLIINKTISGSNVYFYKHSSAASAMAIIVGEKLDFKSSNQSNIILDQFVRLKFDVNASVLRQSGPNSFVKGRMDKTLSTNSTQNVEFTFPCGAFNNSDEPVYAPLKFTITATELNKYNTINGFPNSNIHFTAQYYSENPQLQQSPQNYPYWYLRPFSGTSSYVNHEEHYNSLTSQANKNLDIKVEFGSNSTAPQTQFLQRGIYSSANLFGVWNEFPAGWASANPNIPCSTGVFCLYATEDYSHYRITPQPDSWRVGELADSETIDGFDVQDRIYPNPADNFITIDPGLKEENSRVKLFDAAGKLVMSEDVILYPYSLNVKNLSNGIYFLVVESQSKVIREKVIVTHEEY